jgi:hypothetical protein
MARAIAAGKQRAPGCGYMAYTAHLSQLSQNE